MLAPQYTLDNPCGDVARAGKALEYMGVKVTACHDPKRIMVESLSGGEVNSTEAAIVLAQLAEAASTEHPVTVETVTPVVVPAVGPLVTTPVVKG